MLGSTGIPDGFLVTLQNRAIVRDGCAETEILKILDENLSSAQVSKSTESTDASARSSSFSERADGSTVLGIQSGGDSLSLFDESGSSEEITKSEIRIDDLAHSRFLPLPHHEDRFSSREIDPSFLHGVSSPHSSGSKSRDGLKELCEGISNSTIKGAIWKIARLENGTTLVQMSPMDPLSSTDVNVQKSLTDRTSLNTNEECYDESGSEPPDGFPSEDCDERYSCTFSFAATGCLGVVSYACQRRRTSDGIRS